MKTKQHSTKPKRITNHEKRKEFDIEKTVSQGMWRDAPVKKEYLINLGKDLIMMIYEDKKMVTLLPWIERNNLSRASVDRWKNQYEEFKEIYLEAKYRMGQRILGKALYKEHDSNTARFCLPQYDHEFRELEEWRNNLKKEVAKEAAGKIETVNIPTFYPTGVVPDKVSQ